MAASVLFACGLNELKLPSLIHISEESTMDGSFLISSILCQRLRISNTGTLLICLQHNYDHYTKAGLRLGYDCNIFLGKTLTIIDPLADAVKGFPNNRACITDGNILTDILLQQIQDYTLKSNFSARIHNTVIIDNIAILYNLGASTNNVYNFYYGLMKLADQLSNLTIITKLSNSEIYEIENNNFSKSAAIHLSIIKLKSGTFREVDGKIIIKRYCPDNDENSKNNANAFGVAKLAINETVASDAANVAAASDAINATVATDAANAANVADASSYECNARTKEILYKVKERQIKIYNPGEIGLKV